MKFKLLLACALLAGAVTTSCVDDIPGIDAKEQYTRDFVKTFGVFDPKQDWNAAERATVTVNTTKRTEIQIYADVDGKSYRFATYKNVLGSHTLGVDVPKGVKNLVVKAEGKSYPTQVGGSVNIASRVIVQSGSNGTLTWSVHKDFRKEIPKAVLNAFQSKYPEQQVNLAAGTSSFYFISDGEEHVFYPIYTASDKVHAVGIYYIDPDSDDPDGITMQDLYYTKTGEQVDTSNGYESAGIAYKLPAGVYYGFYLKCGYAADANFFKEIDPQASSGSYGNAASWAGVEVEPNDPEVQGHLFTVFSQATRNTSWVDKSSSSRENGMQKEIRTGEGWAGCSFWDDVEYTELDKHSYAAWDVFSLVVGGEVKTYAAFAFEDYPPAQNMNGGTGLLDSDLNDLVFIFDSEDGHIPEGYDEDDAATWIIACEDLGANDFDFNDVVIGISDVFTDLDDPDNPVTGFKVHALAAGGTLPIYINLKGKIDGEEIIPKGTNEGEFHSWFEGNHTSSTVINAGGYKATGKVVEVEVEGIWSIAEGTDVTIDEENGQGRYGNMGGFTVRVKNDKNNADKEWRYIEAPSTKGLNHDIGEAPQMICVPGSWYWPTEMTHITTCYKNFETWCGDREAGKDWYKNHTGRNVVHHNFGAGGSSSKDDGNEFIDGPIDPQFSSNIFITYGNTAQIKVKNHTGLNGIMLDIISCTPEGIVDIDPETGLITPLKAGEVTVKFNSEELTGKYNKSEDNELKITVNKARPVFTLADTEIAVGQETHLLLNGSPDLSSLADLGDNFMVYATGDKSNCIQVDKSGLIRGLNETGDTPANIWVKFNGDDRYTEIMESYSNDINLSITVLAASGGEEGEGGGDNDGEVGGEYQLSPIGNFQNLYGASYLAQYSLSGIKNIKNATKLKIEFSIPNAGSGVAMGGQYNYYECNNIKDTPITVTADNNYAALFKVLITEGSPYLSIVYYDVPDLDALNGDITITVE